MPKGRCLPKQAFCLRCQGGYLKDAPAQRYCSECAPIVRRASDLQKVRDWRSRKSKDKDWRAQNSIKSAAYVAANKEKSKEYQKRYALIHKAKKAEASAEWRRQNPEKAKALSVKSCAAPARKAYRTSERGRSKQADRYRRYYEDYKFRIDDRISSALRSALNGRKSGRHWETITGYSLSELVCHLEKQFLRGMNWGNIGEWHIDHIVPKSSFIYTDAEDPAFKACWALTNLRPLWGEDNVRKSSKRVYLL